MTYEYVPKLIRAALNNDRKNIESIALMIGRKLKKEDPNISAEIMRILACTNSGSDVMRSICHCLKQCRRYQEKHLKEHLVIRTKILSGALLGKQKRRKYYSRKTMRKLPTFT